MDLQSIVIGGICLALVIVPFIYFQVRGSRREKHLLHSFMDLARQHQLEVSRHDLWSPGYAIGIDSERKRLLYAKRQAGGEVVTLVDLSGVKQCRADVRRDSDGSLGIERIELVFLRHDPSRPQERLELYSREEGMMLNDELRLSEKWVSLVNASLRT